MSSTYPARMIKFPRLYQRCVESSACPISYSTVVALAMAGQSVTPTVTNVLFTATIVTTNMIMVAFLCCNHFGLLATGRTLR